MTTILDEPRIADFLLTNAVVDPEAGLQWRFNLNGIQSGYANFLVAGDYPQWVQRSDSFDARSPERLRER